VFIQRWNYIEHFCQGQSIRFVALGGMGLPNLDV
jgi:hypothetical protein